MINVFVFIITGFLSGLIYFGGLWLTVQYMTGSRFPALITLLSYIIRIAIAFVILIFIARLGQWIYILSWLAGFIIARILLSRSLSRDLSKKTGKES